MANLIRLPKKGTAVLVGDTHGDYQASRLVAKNYLHKNNVVVFLGDYVDRGPASRENISYLLELREKHANLILLAGNHENHPVAECRPCDFWDGLSKDEYETYRAAFLSMPLAVAGNGFIALHGVLPDVSAAAAFDDIAVGDANWYRIVWGDFRDREGEYLGDFLGRPKYGRAYFARIMKALRKNVLVRSHDPIAPHTMFDGRCLTIFTSSAYGRRREIALADLSRTVSSAADMETITF